MFLSTILNLFPIIVQNLHQFSRRMFHFLFLPMKISNATECYIETNHGRIVVSIDEQLNELRESLSKLWKVVIDDEKSGRTNPN